VAQWLPGATFQSELGVAFIAMAGWALVPTSRRERRKGLGARHLPDHTRCLFRRGDRRRDTDCDLAAVRAIPQCRARHHRHDDRHDVDECPAVVLGEAAKTAPLKYVRVAAGAIFTVIGIWVVLAALSIV